MAIKQAVECRQISLDEANEIIMQQQKQTNEQLFKSVQSANQGFAEVLESFKKKMGYKEQ